CPPKKPPSRPTSSGNAAVLAGLQTVKKVPSSRHVRMDGTHTGKLSAESVRGRKAECAVQRSILSPGGYQGEGISVLRSRQKWVPPGAWRFCDTLRSLDNAPASMLS